jgi:phosphorylcholine metabolism protein LicD
MSNINESLSYISKLLNKNSIEYWADSGTLLGIKREGELLKHDPDIDISLV